MGKTPAVETIFVIIKGFLSPEAVESKSDLTAKVKQQVKRFLKDRGATVARFEIYDQAIVVETDRTDAEALLKEFFQKAEHTEIAAIDPMSLIQLQASMKAIKKTIEKQQ